MSVVSDCDNKPNAKKTKKKTHPCTTRPALHPDSEDSKTQFIDRCLVFERVRARSAQTDYRCHACEIAVPRGMHDGPSSPVMRMTRVRGVSNLNLCV